MLFKRKNNEPIMENNREGVNENKNTLEDLYTERLDTIFSDDSMELKNVTTPLSADLVKLNIDNINSNEFTKFETNFLLPLVVLFDIYYTKLTYALISSDSEAFDWYDKYNGKIDDVKIITPIYDRYIKTYVDNWNLNFVTGLYDDFIHENVEFMSKLFKNFIISNSLTQVRSVHLQMRNSNLFVAHLYEHNGICNEFSRFVYSYIFRMFFYIDTTEYIAKERSKNESTK